MNTQKTILTITVLIAFILILVGFYFMLTPDMVRQIDPAQPIGYVFVPDKDEKVGSPHFIQARFWTHSREAIRSVKLFYRLKGEESFRVSEMQQVKQGNVYADEIPPLQEKAARCFYYVEAEDTGGNRVRIPSHAPEKPLLYVTFEGKPFKLTLLLHIVLTVGSTLFFIHGLYYALLLLWEEKNKQAWLRKCFHSIFWAWLSFFFGAIPLGIWITWQTFGEYYGGWPIGSDVTDTKSQYCILYWLLVLFLRRDLLFGKRPSVSDRTFALLVLGGTALTILVFLVPHSLFFQN